MQFHATAKCFKLTFYLLLWPTEKLPFGSLFKTIFPFAFFRAAPNSSTIRMLWETAEETWRRSLGLIVAVKHCGRL